MYSILWADPLDLVKDDRKSRTSKRKGYACFSYFGFFLFGFAQTQITQFSILLFHSATLSTSSSTLVSGTEDVQNWVVPPEEVIGIAHNLPWGICYYTRFEVKGVSANGLLDTMYLLNIYRLVVCALVNEKISTPSRGDSKILWHLDGGYFRISTWHIDI
jgi:hypothetical protein